MDELNPLEVAKRMKKFTEAIDTDQGISEVLAKMLFVLENITQAVFITDLSAQIKWVNSSALRMTGYTETELIGSNMRILKSNLQNKKFYENMWKGLLNTGTFQDEFWNRKKDGTPYLQWVRIFTIRNEANEAREYVSICTDLTEREEFLTSLNRSDFYDNLTGLPNKALLKKNMQDTSKNKDYQSFKQYFVALNIDRFSYINMSFGYNLGDQLLIEVAKRISSRLRISDSAYRLGGDLFIILFRDVSNVETLVAIVNRINELINEPFFLLDKNINITASYGISVFPNDGEDFESLIQHAESALKEAQDAGKNKIRFFSYENDEKVNRWFKLGNELSDAIKHNDLMLYYQIQVENVSEKIKGVEVLVRWNHEKLGILGPNEFIPYAEISGLIVPLGYWVIEQTFMIIKDFKDRKLPSIMYSINLSPKQITEKDLVKKIMQLVKTYSIDPKQVEFEITESGAIQNSALTISLFKQLKKNGFTLAIDDFGTGYSSLSYLADLSIDIIKIDRSFISNIDKKENQRKITTAILSMAETIGMRTVAEGVETKEEVMFLSNKKCDLLQGYYYSKPVNAELFEKQLLKQNN